MSTDTVDPKLPPNAAARALDAATDMSRTLGEILGSLRAAIDRLSTTMTDARRPGTTLSTVSAMAREAPLASLFVAFMVGIAVARRR